MQRNFSALQEELFVKQVLRAGMWAAQSMFTFFYLREAATGQWMILHGCGAGVNVLCNSRHKAIILVVFLILPFNPWSPDVERNILFIYHVCATQTQRVKGYIAVVGFARHTVVLLLSSLSPFSFSFLEMRVTGTTWDSFVEYLAEHHHYEIQSFH